MVKVTLLEVDSNSFQCQALFLLYYRMQFVEQDYYCDDVFFLDVIIALVEVTIYC